MEKVIHLQGGDLKVGRVFEKSEVGILRIHDYKGNDWWAFEEETNPYTAANMLAAMKTRKAYNEAQDRALFEQYAADFPTEAHRDEIHEGADAQIEHGRKYAVKSIHLPFGAQNEVA